MRFVSCIAAAAMSAGLAVSAAHAAPNALLQSAVDTGPAPQLKLVRAGCGFGEHRSWYGRCHYNHGWRGHVRARHNYYRRHW